MQGMGFGFGSFVPRSYGFYCGCRVFLHLRSFGL